MSAESQTFAMPDEAPDDTGNTNADFQELYLDVELIIAEPASLTRSKSLRINAEILAPDPLQ
jgi:hypothetical protein